MKQLWSVKFWPSAAVSCHLDSQSWHRLSMVIVGVVPVLVTLMY